MTKRILLGAVLCALLLPLAVPAQEEPPAPYAYVTYFQCDPAREWLADDIVAKHMAPHYDAAVEEGTLSSWGYLAHHTGGKWRRAIYRVTPTLEGALAALDSVGEKVEAARPGANAAFSDICGSHDDYIWRPVTGSTGSQVAQNRGEAGFSVYYVCDEATEEEADRLVKETFAPIYDAQVAAGRLVSWTWMQHWVGGEYRRINSMTGTDLPSLVAARDAIVQAMVEQEEAISAFSAICGSHADYMWGIVHETP